MPAEAVGNFIEQINPFFDILGLRKQLQKAIRLGPKILCLNVGGYIAKQQ